uniref:AlNc14C29G2770 protein n=1 Tax=Albugo laibachii Nc14 TaxID=890382 RepID=F0W7F4_9STRA|nr:AlNc14C29G2770 [Albugo laibachii Nc14]|eukprot:CCA17055.1 AlNc14C29G2770 [Albugo laibachii Nc14]
MITQKISQKLYPVLAMEKTTSHHAIPRDGHAIHRDVHAIHRDVHAIHRDVHAILLDVHPILHDAVRIGFALDRIAHFALRESPHASCFRDSYLWRLTSSDHLIYST